MTYDAVKSDVITETIFASRLPYSVVSCEGIRRPPARACERRECAREGGRGQARLRQALWSFAARARTFLRTKEYSSDSPKPSTASGNASSTASAASFITRSARASLGFSNACASAKRWKPLPSTRTTIQHSGSSASCRSKPLTYSKRLFAMAARGARRARPLGARSVGPRAPPYWLRAAAAANLRFAHALRTRARLEKRALAEGVGAALARGGARRQPSRAPLTRCGIHVAHYS